MLIDFFQLPTASLIYILLLATGMLIALTIIARVLMRYGVAAIALQPIVPFAMFFSIIHFFTPAIKILQGPYRYQSRYDPETLLLTAAISVALLTLASLLSRSAQFSPMPRSGVKANFHRGAEFREKAVSLLIYGIGALAAIEDAYRILFEIGYLDFMRDTHGASIYRSPLRLLSNFMILGSALFLASILSSGNRSRNRWISVTLLLVPVVFYATLLNSRNVLLLTAIIHVTVFCAFTYLPVEARANRPPIAIGRRTLKKAAFVALALVLVFFGSAEITKLRYGNFDSEYSLERMERVFYYTLDGAFGNDENVLWMQEYQRMEFQYGWTYVAGFLNIIPRWIWPAKPDGAGPILINMVRPGSYVAGQEGNNSFTTGLVTEAYMNFGYPGVLLSVVAWAYLSSRALRAFHRTSNVFYRTGFLLVALLLSSSLLYSEFLGFFGRAFVLVVPIFLLGFLLAPCSQRTSRLDVLTRWKARNL